MLAPSPMRASFSMLASFPMLIRLPSLIHGTPAGAMRHSPSRFQSFVASFRSMVVLMFGVQLGRFAWNPINAPW